MSRKKILLIHGEPTMRELVQMCLSYLGGWQVTSVSSPVEGLHRAAKEQPDAIVLDLSYSGMDYGTFLQRLQVDPTMQFIPVIVLVTNAKWSNLKHFDSLQISGVIDYLSNPEEIPKQISKLLDWDEEVFSNSCKLD